MTPVKGANFFSQLQQQLLSDPRKATVLGALLLVLGFMIVRTVASAGPQPRAAHGSHPNLRLTPAGTLEREASRSRSDSPVERWLSTSAPPLGRNLFEIDYELFPTDLTGSQEKVASEGFWDDIAKSMNLRADQQGRRQESVQRVASQAKALQVTSVMMGPKPRAVINGELVGEGEVVASFRVLKIEARRIIVEREGIRLEIQMN